MEKTEEFFIVRYHGSEQCSQFLHEFLTGQSTDYYRYSALLKDMEVGRATCLKHIFDFLSSKPSTSSLPDESSPEKRKTHEPVFPDSSLGHKEVKTEVEDVEFKRKDLLMTSDETEKATVSSIFSEIHTSPIKPLMQPCKYERTSVPSQNMLSLSRLYQPIRRPPPLPNEIDAGSDTKRKRSKLLPIDIKKQIQAFPRSEYSGIRPKRATRVVSSQTLKRQNICFERSQLQ